MDAATAASLAALAIAIAAMFITTAQALQQYLITGQLIRLCDSVVFGDLPGQGRRIWEPSQFRFRVVYKIPQIGLQRDFWPSSAAPSFATTDLALPDLSSEIGKIHQSSAGFKLPISNARQPSASQLFNRRSRITKLKYHVGEASWASFCRTVHYSCHASIGYQFAEGDADRCPIDLPTVPMQASLRDLVVMALMAGLECTAASFERGSISMQGAAGTITSSQHPVLGPTVHFIPRSKSELHGIGLSGKVSKDWLWRTTGNCLIAHRHYNWRGRRAVEKEIGKFLSGHERRNLAARDLVPFEKDNGPRHTQHAEEQEYSLDNASAAVAPPKFPLATPLQPTGEDWRLVQRPRIANRHHPQYLAHGEPPQPDFKTAMSNGEVRTAMSNGAVNNMAPTANSQPRRMYTRMARKYLSPEILKRFNVDYTFDQDPEFILIKRWVPEAEQDFLWEATRQLREERASQAEQSATPDNPNTPNEEINNDSFTRRGVERDKRKMKDTRKRNPTTRDSLDESEASSEWVTVSDGDSEASLDHYGSLSNSNSKQAFQPTVDDDSDESTGNITAEASRRPKLPNNVRDLVPLGRKPPHEKDNAQIPMGLPNRPFNPVHERVEQNADDDNLARKKTEQTARLARKTERENRQAINWKTASELGNINWFWLSQTDILAGFWATPWRSFENLSVQVCAGGIIVLIEAIESLIGKGCLQYIPFSSSLQDESITGTINWMMEGKPTFPAYAYNSKGGVVCPGTYASITYHAFVQQIPAVELLDSYSHQANSYTQKSQAACERRIVELMRLDSWLSIVGRMGEIRSGRTDLLRQTPALVQALINEFDLDFRDADLSSHDGGAQTNQEIAANIKDHLVELELDEAEVLYTLVATLRAIKVGQCVLTGPDTRMLIEIFEKDIQVYLV